MFDIIKKPMKGISKLSIKNQSVVVDNLRSGFSGEGVRGGEEKPDINVGLTVFREKCKYPSIRVCVLCKENLKIKYSSCTVV